MQVDRSLGPALGDRRIVPGKRVGTLELGMRYRAVAGVLGPAPLAVRERLGFVRYPELDLDLILRTAPDDGGSSDARVIAIVIAGGVWTGLPRPGDLRAVVDDSLGEPTLLGARALYAAGVSVYYESTDTVATVVVRAPFLGDLFPASHLASTVVNESAAPTRTRGGSRA